MRKKLASRGFFSVVGLIALSLLASCANQQISSPQQIIASPNDKREYRYLTLPNQLQVILVADSTADKAAASLSVSVGSSNDPQDREGLAHFLEHMLFLGTGKYPLPDEYQSFISSHGGSHNAYTAFDETNYFFDIDPAHLEPALDRFSRFFVDPLFNPDYVEREKHAVHSEYTAKLKNDYRRQQDAFRQVVNPQHPISQFSVGSLETLADRDSGGVREDLLKFYRQHYSANRMGLVVQAPLTLDQLEALIRDRFVDIPDRQSKKPEIAESIFQPEQLPLLLSLKPEQELRRLEVQFSVPSVQKFYRQKPLAYIGYLLGHEGAGSLLATLKARGWADGLSAGLALDDGNSALFGVSVHLTIAGLEQHEQIRQLLYAELNLIRTQGIEGWRFQEQGELAAMQFRFEEPVPPSSHVMRLSSRLHDYPATDVLRAPYLMDQYNAELITEYLGYLKPERALEVLVSPEAKTDRVTRLYEVPYSVRRLESGVAGEEQLATEKQVLSLPDENPYIPGNFNLLLKEGEKSRPVPELLVDQPTYRVWHFQDHVFKVPRQQFSLTIKTPVVATARGAALTDLYLALVEEKLNETGYAAALAGLGFGVSRSADGIAMGVSGFSDKLPLLAEEVAVALSSLNWRDEDFERIRQQLIRAGRNASKDAPYRQVWREVGYVLRPESSSPQQIAEELESITRSGLHEFVQGLFTNARLEYLIGGNVEAKDARKLARRVQEILPITGSPDSELTRPVIRLNRTMMPRVVLALDHNDNALMRYVQGRDESLAEHAKLLMLKQMIKAPFFHSLRTEQQLGYVVATVDLPLERVPGLGLLVQSPVATVDELESAVNEFLASYSQAVYQQSSEEFEKHRQSLLSDLLEKPKNLSEQMSRFHGELDLRYTGFDYRQRLIRAVEKVSQSEVMQSYSDLLMQPGRSLVVVHGEGSGTTEPVSDKERFKLPSR